MQLRVLLVLLCWVASFWSHVVISSPKVAVSIAPIHSLVAAVMQGVGEPKLLIPPGQSPHTQSLTPSSIREAFNSDLVIWVSPDYEISMTKIVGQANKNTVVKTLIEDSALTILEKRENGSIFEHEEESSIEHDVDHHKHEHMVFDPHLWLSAENAKTCN